MTKRAKSSFVTASNPPRVVRSGALFQDSDPVIKGREGLFEDVDDYIERISNRPEQATAAPGEKRSVPSVRKRAVKKDDSEGADK